VLNEFYRVAFRKRVYRSIDELQADLTFKDLNLTRLNDRRLTDYRRACRLRVAVLQSDAEPHRI
jgi:hypothetical protein